MFFFFSSRRRHTRLQGDWSSDVCSSDLATLGDHVHESATRSAEFRVRALRDHNHLAHGVEVEREWRPLSAALLAEDRKSTRLNSSHLVISYAVFCLKKRKLRIGPKSSAR